MNSDFIEYLDILKRLPVPKDERTMTFARALGKDRNENFISDCLAFIINPDLFQDERPFQALLRLAGVDDAGIPDGIEIEREVSFQDGRGRIDILIRTKDFLIGIENKIDSGLGYKQLNRYSKALAEYDKHEWDESQIYKILLYPKGNKYIDSVHDLAGFIPITYEDLADAFEQIHSREFSESISRFLFDDFIIHIKETINMPAFADYYDVNQEFLQYYISNYSSLKKAEAALREASNSFRNSIRAALQSIEAVANEENGWIIGEPKSSYIQIYKENPRWNEELQVHFELLFYGDEKETAVPPCRINLVFHSNERKSTNRTPDLKGMQENVKKYLTNKYTDDFFKIDYSTKQTYNESMGVLLQAVNDLLTEFGPKIDVEVKKSLDGLE